jgi:hypothetical protein
MGDPACQSGAASYFMGYGNICGIHVTTPGISYQVSDWSGTHSVRGVEGTRPINSAWAVAEGDCGGLVYVQTGSNSYRGARHRLRLPHPLRLLLRLRWPRCRRCVHRLERSS